MSSSRRAKKGPGRRPRPAKRHRFMELRERGLSIDAAAREVGVSRTAGRNWAKGYRTYRAGRVVGCVPALDRLEVRGNSPRFLSEDERIELADLHRAGVSVRAIVRRTDEHIDLAPVTGCSTLNETTCRRATARLIE